MEALTSAFYALVILFVVLWYFWRYDGETKRVHVVVLGDIGRSPRMQYHSLSLAQNGFAVNVIGYSGMSLFLMLYTKHYPARKIQCDSHAN